MKSVAVFLTTCGKGSIDNGWQLNRLQIAICCRFRKRSNFKAEASGNAEVGYQTNFTGACWGIFGYLKLCGDDTSPGACLQEIDDLVTVIFRDVGSAQLNHPVNSLLPGIRRQHSVIGAANLVTG